MKAIRDYVGVPDSIGEHYWHPAESKGYWSIIHPLGLALVNAATNPSFETNTDGWVTIGTGTTIQQHTSAAMYGNYGALVVTTAATRGIGYEFFDDFATGTAYSACVSVDGPVGAVVEFRFEFITGGSVIVGIPTVATLPGYPIRICCTLEPQPGAPFLPTLPISLRFSQAGMYFVDGLVVTSNIQPTTSYFDGDSPDAVWLGEAHNSSSSVSAFSRTLGERVNLNEIGFNVTGASGFGLTPRQLITSPYARQNGAHLQRVRDDPRVIAITGTFEGSPEEMHVTRQAVIDALSWRFKNQCTQELILCYALYDECNQQVSQELQIPAEYQSGLEGNWTSLDRERATLVFVANTEQSWSVPFENSVDLSATGSGGTTIITNEGDEDAWVELQIWPGVTGINIHELHNDTTGHSLYFGSSTDGTPTHLPVAANSYVILRNDPARRVSMDLYTINTVLHTTTTARIMRYIRYPNSQLGLFRLVPGDNQFRNVISSASTGSRIFVKWRTRYLSVDALCWGPP